jgi:tetratricopeptide (TPR) repeat protein
MKEGIAVFQGPVSRADEFAALAGKIGVGSARDDEKFLSALQSLAHEVGESEGWNRYALALYDAHRHLEASDILRRLLAISDSDAHRLNLAAAYSQVHFIDLCRYELRAVADAGTEDEMRAIARRQLREFEVFVGVDPETQKLRTLQLAAFNRKVADVDAGVGDIVQFATLLLTQARSIGDEELTERARQVLEGGQSRFPTNMEIIKYLLQVYVGADDPEPLSRLLSFVRRQDPHSPLLRIVDAYSAGPVGSIFAVYGEALVGLGHGSADLWAPAAADFGRLLASHPGNSDIRLQYGWLLIAGGKTDLAGKQAARLAGISGRSHAFHFNLGQLCWMTGDSVAGRRHLDIAMSTANTREDAQDVRDAIERLSAR